MTDSLITYQSIPELSLIAGQKIEIDFNQYFSASDGSTLQFTLEGFPEQFHFDQPKGILSGITPVIAVDTPFLVTVIATHLETKEQSTQYFALRIIGSNSQAIATELQVHNRELLLKQIEYLISLHFPVVYLYDAYNPPMAFGALLEQRVAQSGFSIYSFDNCIVITSGDKAFEEYGNRNRLLKTLEETFTEDLPKKIWSKTGVGLSSTDLQTLGRAWVVARLLNVPVSEEAPTQQAFASYKKLYQLTGERPIAKLNLN